MKQACRQTLKSLAAECLVGVRLGLLNFLTPVCVDRLFWLLAFGAGVFVWTDVVDTLPGSGLVGWCLESVFLLIQTQLQFYPAPNVNLGIDREGQRKAKRSDGQQKGILAHVKRNVATAVSMKVKPAQKYRHSCAFAPISAVEACLENSPSSLHFLFCCNFYSLEAASKPALKPAARLILKDCLFCSKFAWSRTGVGTEDANAFFPSCRKPAVLR